MSFSIQDLIDNGISTEIITKFVEKYGIEEFVHAVDNDKPEIVKLLLTYGLDIHQSYGYPLKYASQKGNLEIVKLLLDHDAAEPNEFGNALYVAVVCKEVEIVKLLINKGADAAWENNYALIHAASFGYLEIVQVLIDNGADVNCKNGICLNYAARDGRLEVVKFLVSKGANIKTNGTPLLWAASRGRLPVVEFLLANGPDIDQEDSIILLRTAENGHFEMVKYLLNKGIKLSDDVVYATRNQDIKKFLIDYKPAYYGIESDVKLDIKLPDLLELIRNGKYYYVYRCSSSGLGFVISDMNIKNGILSQIGNAEIKYFHNI